MPSYFCNFAIFQLVSTTFLLPNAVMSGGVAELTPPIVGAAKMRFAARPSAAQFYGHNNNSSQNYHAPPSPRLSSKAPQLTKALVVEQPILELAEIAPQLPQHPMPFTAYWNIVNEQYQGALPADVIALTMIKLIDAFNRWIGVTTAAELDQDSYHAEFDGVVTSSNFIVQKLPDNKMQQETEQDEDVLSDVEIMFRNIDGIPCIERQLFQSPEQFKSKLHGKCVGISLEADIVWSLGVLLYGMLSNRHPLDAFLHASMQAGLQENAQREKLRQMMINVLNQKMELPIPYGEEVIAIPCFVVDQDSEKSWSEDNAEGSEHRKINGKMNAKVETAEKLDSVTRNEEKVKNAEKSGPVSKINGQTSGAITAKSTDSALNINGNTGKTGHDEIHADTEESVCDTEGYERLIGLAKRCLLTRKDKRISVSCLRKQLRRIVVGEVDYLQNIVAGRAWSC